jgi:hypothetical protein
MVSSDAARPTRTRLSLPNTRLRLSRVGLVPLAYRSTNSFRLPHVRMPSDFCHLVTSAAAVDYIIVSAVPITPWQRDFT